MYCTPEPAGLKVDGYAAASARRTRLAAIGRDRDLERSDSDAHHALPTIWSLSSEMSVSEVAEIVCLIDSIRSQAAQTPAKLEVWVT